MNPELVIPEGFGMVLTLLMLGSTVVGFLLGFLTSNAIANKRLEEIEAALEELFNTELDEYFDDDEGK